MKRTSSDVDSPQNEENVSSECQEEETAKRRKQEMEPLEMGGILEKVFFFLDAESIKNARLVTKLWSTEGAKVLLTKYYVKIPLNLRVGTTVSRATHLKQFQAFLAHKSTDVAVIPKIKIIHEEDIELWEYLGVLGPQVTKLNFNLSIVKEGLFSKLLDLLSNLKYLDFGKVWLCNQEHVDILEALTSTMSNVEKDGKLIIISNTKLVPKTVEDLVGIEKFSGCRNIRIKELCVSVWYDEVLRNVPDFKARLASCLNKILSANQNRLKILWLLYDVPLTLLDFPKMTALTKFKLCVSPNAFTHWKFSTTFRFSEKIPNLHGFTIWFQRNGPIDQDVLANLFENTGIAPSVKHLKVDDGVFDFSIHHLFQTFPNIKEFQSDELGNPLAVLGSLLQYGKNLRKLNLKIFLDKVIGDVADLDSTFAGFTPEMTEWLKKAPEGVLGSIGDLEKFRINPSIRNLRELKDLKMELHGTERSCIPNRLLAVAGEHAFKLMPKTFKVSLTVNVSKITIEQAMEALDEVSKVPNVSAQFSINDDESQIWTENTDG